MTYNKIGTNGLISSLSLAVFVLHQTEIYLLSIILFFYFFTAERWTTEQHYQNFFDETWSQSQRCRVPQRRLFTQPSCSDQTLSIFPERRPKPSLAKIHRSTTYFSQGGANNHHRGLRVTQKRIITAEGGPVGERWEECRQKTADRGSKLTSADAFYFTTRPLWTHLCYF